MLPDIKAKNRRITVHQGAVLVAAAFHHQRVLRRDAQPGPTTAEPSQGGLGEGILERFKTTQLGLDGLGQLPLRLAAALR
ncbi:hypothetical protein D3C76_1221290 [compost metagenome]